MNEAVLVPSAWIFTLCVICCLIMIYQSRYTGPRLPELRVISLSIAFLGLSGVHFILYEHTPEWFRILLLNGSYLSSALCMLIFSRMRFDLYHSANVFIKYGVFILASLTLSLSLHYMASDDFTLITMMTSCGVTVILGWALVIYQSKVVLHHFTDRLLCYAIAFQAILPLLATCILLFTGDWVLMFYLILLVETVAVVMITAASLMDVVHWKRMESSLQNQSADSSTE